MRRLAPLLALALLPACKGGSKDPGAKTGVVVIAVNGHEVKEGDSALSFGEACVQNADVPPTVQSVVIKNSGGSALTVSAVITGANASSFTLGAVPSSIAPGGQGQLDVQFAPKSGGAQSASLDVTTSDPAAPLVHVRLTGTGASKLPKPSYATVCTDASGATTGPDSCQYLAFPDTAVGATGTQKVHVTNDGCPPLELTGLSVVTDPSNRLVDGGPTFAFHGTAPTATSPIKLAAGESTDLLFDFIPAGNTLFTADLYVQTNGVHDPQFTHQGFFPDGGPITDDVFYVQLSGQGTSADLALTPSSCDFSQTDGGQGCGAHVISPAGDVAGTFTLINSGNAGVQVSALNIDVDGGVFTASSTTLPGTLAASSSAEITVTYHPINGNALAHLQVVTSKGTPTATLVGGSPPVIALSPSFLSFNDGGIPGDGGAADPSTLVSSRSFTVSNSGRGVLSVSGVAFVDPTATGADGGSVDAGCDGFAVQSPTPPFTVAPGAGTTVSLRFTRDRHSGGVVTCEAHVLSNDLLNPSPLVRLYASSYVNCDPIADFVPNGPVTFPVAADGGVFLIDGSSSFDTDATTSPACANGQSDGLSSFEWTLTRTGQGSPASTTHLEPPAGIGSCGASSGDCAICVRKDPASQQCVDLKVVAALPVFPTSSSSAPLVNLVLDSAHDATGNNSWDLSLVVTDGSGRKSGPSGTLQIAGQ